MRSSVLVLLGLSAVVAQAGGPAPPRWGPPVLAGELRTVAQATELKTVDVDGDGLRDVVVVQLRYPEFETFPITILLNRGGGRFVDGTDALFEGSVPRTQWARKIVTADFNGDRRTDIFVADTGTDILGTTLPGHQNVLALSTPRGGLVDASANLPQQRDATHSATAADVDGNGSVDLYLGNFTCCGDRTPPQLLLNDGAGRFTVARDRLDGGAAHGPNFTPYTTSELVDVNRDGSPDLVLGGMEYWPRSIVLLNDGAGSFRYFADLPRKAYGDNGIVLDFAAVELNGDGAVDLLSAESQTEPYYIGTRIQVLINEGAGTFRDETATRFPQQPNGQSWPNRLLVEHFDDDGQPDLAVQYAPQGIVAVPDPTPFWVNRGGVFERIAGATSGAFPHARGPVGFVDGKGRHAFFSVEASAQGGFRRYYVSAQLHGPRTPTGVVATRSLRTGVRVRWRRVEEATGYEVWRSPSRRRDGARVARTTATVFLDRSAARGRTYMYRVRAVNTEGVSAASGPALGRRR